VSRFGLSWVSVVGAVVVAAAIVGAAYVVARTPGDVISGTVVVPSSPPALGENVEYTLAPGRNASAIGSDLERLGVIRSSRQFELLVSLMGVQEKLSAGDYTFAKNTAAANVISAITVKDAVAVRKVTFPEGIRVEEMAVIAQKAGFGTAQDFLDAVTNAPIPPDIAAMLPPEGTVPGYRLQGFLFPDTYIMPVGATPADLVHLMLTTFLKRFAPELRAQAAAQGLTPYQAITLAAIVEREAVLAGERPHIAGVFYNRLAAGESLGADPTVQFAVALDPASVEQNGYWKRELTLEDLRNPSPYNTYLVAGLPPGPITNPGLASIQAVAEPTKTDDYYFVADAKKADGSHVFAKTLAEHEANIAAVGSP
jgi:UPF0755 protein